MLVFSERSGLGGETNALTRRAAERRARGEAIVDLTISNPTSAGLPYPEDEVRAALTAQIFPYEAHPLGHPSGRRAVAAAVGREGASIDASQVLLTASTSEAYSYLLTLLCDPGDEILVPRPSYPLLSQLAQLGGVHLSTYPLRCDGRWSLDAAELFEAVTDRTRAIVVVSPNNPTGGYLTEDELALLTSFGLPLIVDEVFYEYPLAPPPDRVRAARCETVLTFALDGLSKRAALPQLKLAWTTVTGPAEMVEEAMHRLEAIADTYLSPSTPVSTALAALLSCSEPTRQAITERCRENLARLQESVRGTSITVPRVEGGWYAPVRLPATETDESWALALLDRGVLAHPGYFYDLPDDEAWLVLSLLTPPADFERGRDALVELVRARGAL